jgi:putative ABC transport system substrate-binding protein
MKRREFLALLGGTAACPLTARAIEPVRMRRVGVLLGGAEHDLDWQRLEPAFEQELHRHGWSRGRDIRIDFRWPGDEIDRINAHAIELVELGPEVVVTATIYGVRAIRRRTEKIPIVFVNVADPVGNGLIASLARPGGNMTGFAGIDHAICAKWVEIVKALAPRTARLALVFNPNTAPEDGGFLDPLLAAAQSSDIKPLSLPVRTEGEAERAIQEFARTPNGALIALPESSTVFHRTSIIGAANKQKVPALFPYRFCVAGGGLVSYGLDMVAQCRSAAAYVDKILHGEKIGNIPAQTPKKFELAINQKTAKALGLAVPPQWLARADEIVE